MLHDALKIIIGQKHEICGHAQHRVRNPEVLDRQLQITEWIHRLVGRFTPVPYDVLGRQHATGLCMLTVKLKIQIGRDHEDVFLRRKEALEVLRHAHQVLNGGRFAQL